jgi:Predicted redox protein, regulator of disulfide bond formation
VGGRPALRHREGGRPHRAPRRKRRNGTESPRRLLSALASCAAIDVVEILAKRRTPVESLEVDVVGDRYDGTPRRFTHITLFFRVSGAGIEREQAERAIELSVNKYCSVRDSLREDIGIEWTLELSGGAA